MFGDIMGTVYVGENGVPVHVHDNDQVGDDDHEYHTWDGAYGLKWECVELARRYLHLASGGRYMLPYVDTALDLWNLWNLWNLSDLGNLQDPSVPGEGARF